MTELVIKTIQANELDSVTRKVIIDVCVDAHKNPEFYELFDFVAPDNVHVIAYRGDALIGHAMVSTRWMQPEGHPILRSAYIDAVSVAPSEQGKGVGKAVMLGIAAVIGDYEIAGLETDKFGFYESVGWECWHGTLAGRGAEGLIPTPDQHGVMILRLPKTPALNPLGLLTIEDQGARIW